MLQNWISLSKTYHCIIHFIKSYLCLFHMNNVLNEYDKIKNIFKLNA